MSWCDRLASTPGVGFRLTPYYASSESVFDAWQPMLSKWAKSERMPFTVDKQDAFSATITTEDGFQYGTDPNRSFVNFYHRIRPKSVSGGPPVMEMLSRPRPYTDLLPEVSERLVDATLMLPGNKTRNVLRVGVVSTTKVSEGDIPPGIKRFIEYIGRPWKASSASYQIHLTADLGAAGGLHDRCVHTLTKPEDEPDGLISLNFDWQRAFDSERAASRDNLIEMLGKAQKAALAYFEDLAEGSRFDEDVIRATA